MHDLEIVKVKQFSFCKAKLDSYNTRPSITTKKIRSKLNDRSKYRNRHPNRNMLRSNSET